MDSKLNNFDLPHCYGDNKIVLIVRDPRTLYAYWEISEDVEGRVREDIQAKGLTASKSILRLYRITEEGSSEEKTLDFELKDNANSWYINKIDPAKKWRLDIGILSSNDDFFPLAQSNVVETPPSGASDVYDSSDELLGQHLSGWRSSGGFSSAMSNSIELIIE